MSGLKDLAMFFSSEDQQELKQSFKNILIEQFKSELKDLDVYLFNPSRIEDMIHDLYEECVLEIQEDLKKMIKKQFKENLSKTSNESIIKILENNN